MSDNGADALDLAAHSAYSQWFNQIGIDNTYANIGNVRSFIMPGAAWAQVSSTPFWGAKGTVAEGGIRSSFLVSYTGPNPVNPIIPAGSKSAALGSVRDLTPTFLDYAGILSQHPGVANPGAGQVYALDGRSLRAMWEGTATNSYGPNDYVGYELFGTTNKALISGDGWKILRLGDSPWGDAGNKHESDQPWKLFNLNSDPGEQTNLATQYPERLRDMQVRYSAYEAGVGFVSAYLRNTGSPGQKATHTFNLTNRLDVEDTLELTCNAVWECDVRSGASGLIATQATSTTVKLQSGQAVPVTMTLTIPPDVKPGGSGYVNAIRVASAKDPGLVVNYTVITSIAPTITGVSADPSSGRLKFGDKVKILVTFSAPVTVTGTPQLTLETGATDAVVNYSGGSGTNVLTFTYTVGVGHTTADLDYAGTGALKLNGGSIADASGAAAALTLPAPGAAGSLGANTTITINGRLFYLPIIQR